MRANNGTASFYGVRRSYLRQSVLIPAVLALLLTTAGRLGSLQLTDRYTKQLEQSTAALHPATIISKAQNTQLGVSPGSNTTANNGTTPNCTPDTSYQTPTGIDLSSAPQGLTQLTDPIHLYRIYGLTSDELAQQINRCAPKLAGDEEFTGYTVYNLSWRYDFVITTANQCALQNVKVGLHTNEVLPLWQPTPLTTTSFAQQWQSFATNLHRHELGHTAIDVQYAAQLVQDLQALQANDCDVLAQTAKATIQHDVSSLNRANDAYDASTQHGVTQGAILP